jgi:hypothetical protein
MVYLARGRDVDKPAVVVLLDGDGEADKIAEELHKGYRGKQYVDDDLVVRTSQIDPASVAISTDVVREIEDLIPAEVAVLAVHRFAREVLSTKDAEAIKTQVQKLEPVAGAKLYKTAEASCAALPEGLRLDKVGFARAVLETLENDAPDPILEQTLANFEQLFTELARAQREAIRRNSRERVRRTIARFNRAFLRDHPFGAKRHEVVALLEEIESQLVEVTDETEQIRTNMRLLRTEFALAEEPESNVGTFDVLVERLNDLQYAGLREAQD